MWNRKEIKAKGKAAFKRNFWLCVLISLAIILPTLISGSVTIKTVQKTFNLREWTQQLFGASYYAYTGSADIISAEDFASSMQEILLPAISVTVKSTGLAKLAEILLFSVIEVGACIFFIRNSKENAQAECIFDGFKSDRYGTIVVTKFLMGLFISLWSLLFVIPGIIKSYEYCMIPYILADHPEVSRKEAFAMSKRMMKGNKWKTFVFDLSFLGWYLLNLLTFNLLSYLFINPYKNAAMAELYLALKEEA